MAGLLNRRSVPTLVLGKAITSRMDWVLQSIAISRSKPRPDTNSVRNFYKEEMYAITQCYSSVRRCTELQGVKQVAKGCHLVWRELTEVSLSIPSRHPMEGNAYL